MLMDAGLQIDRQKLLPIEYGGLTIADAFRTDLIVEGQLIIEVKSVQQLAPVHSKQLLFEIDEAAPRAASKFRIGDISRRREEGGQRSHEFRVFAIRIGPLI